jgi:hypothetical protein
MNIVADESIDRPIVLELRQDGHDVVYIAELSPSISDDQVLELVCWSQSLRLRLFVVHGFVVPCRTNR